MKFKAVITDLDGTAVNSPEQKQASQRLKNAVRQLEKSGIKVCAATGRAISFAKPLLLSMGLTGPAIVAGGTKIIDSQSFQELWSCAISDEAMAKVKAEVESMPYGYLWNDYIEDDYLNGGWQLADMPVNEKNVYFFEIVFVPDDEAFALAGRLSTIPDIAATVVVAQRSGMRDIHITNARATKEHAIHELEAMLDISKAEMIGVGDGHNDLHLYNAVGYKVAMSNAVPELKEVADEVIGAVQDDGLAEYFERLAHEVKENR
ncbi:HAD-superfamily hydrolase, subfamily IIB [Candidatus Saccharibacteria bacterium RAAC3_TM7_1]|nr:HAD-superfamily hydrolase, subfamily IIB [Candidatus Saccharibacteria bacterium RAAC3_TM7_1]